MKKFARLILYFLVVSRGKDLTAQGSFQNLNFESATNLPNLPSNETAYVAISNAMPGWTAYEGGTQVTQVLYDGVSLGGVLVSLVGTNTGGPNVNGHGPLAGNYSATVDDGEGGDGSAAIAQTGRVPSTAKSMVFIASGDIADQYGALSVTLNGQNLPISEIVPGTSYNEYGVDVSAFAGSTGQLEFTENISTGAALGVTYLDNITFSPSAVPEPSSLALFLGGAALLGIARFRCRRNP